MKIYADPKGSISLMEEVNALYAEQNRGRKAYGEWMKRLSMTDRAPRGKCSTYFQSNAHSRPALAGSEQAMHKNQLALVKLSSRGK